MGVKLTSGVTRGREERTAPGDTIHLGDIFKKSRYFYGWIYRNSGQTKISERRRGWEWWRWLKKITNLGGKMKKSDTISYTAPGDTNLSDATATLLSFECTEHRSRCPWNKWSPGPYWVVRLCLPVVGNCGHSGSSSVDDRVFAEVSSFLKLQLLQLCSASLAT